MIKVTGMTHKYKEQQAVVFKVEKNGSTKKISFPFKDENELHYIIPDAMEAITKLLNRL